MSGGFFRGTTHDQTPYFADKQRKEIEETEWPAHFETPVDMDRVHLKVIRPWIAQKIHDLLGYEDDIVTLYCVQLLEKSAEGDDESICPKKMATSLQGFLAGGKALKYVSDLWSLLLQAQSSASGIPRELVESKMEEVRKQEAEVDRLRKDLDAARENRNVRRRDRSHSERRRSRSLRRRDSPRRRRESPRRESRRRLKSSSNESRQQSPERRRGDDRPRSRDRSRQDRDKSQERSRRRSLDRRHRSPVARPSRRPRRWSSGSRSPPPRHENRRTYRGPRRYSTSTERSFPRGSKRDRRRSPRRSRGSSHSPLRSREPSQQGCAPPQNSNHRDPFSELSTLRKVARRVILNKD